MLASLLRRLLLLLLLLQVGSVNNTFGVKGVEEHCLMFKTIQDAHKLRGQLSDCFERAALPYVSDNA
jgi:NADH:ubiquinone reductase (non-electrogenic)